jgi:hypothetical protein
MTFSGRLISSVVAAVRMARRAPAPDVFRISTRPTKRPGRQARADRCPNLHLHDCDTPAIRRPQLIAIKPGRSRKRASDQASVSGADDGNRTALSAWEREAAELIARHTPDLRGSSWLASAALGRFRTRPPTSCPCLFMISCGSAAWRDQWSMVAMLAWECRSPAAGVRAFSRAS